MPILRLLTLPVLGLALAAAPAWASPISDALDEVDTAIDAARDEGGRCQRTVVADLRDLAEDLADARRGRGSLRKLRRALEDIADAAEEDCPRSVSRALGKAVRELKDGEDDDDRRGKKRQKRVPCWNDSDPGCGGTRGGHGPMARAAFDSLMTAVRGAKPHVFPMQDVVRSMMGNQYLTALQLSILVEAFKPHVFPMQDVVKICAPKLVDPQNGGVVSAQFKPHVFPMQDVTRIISAQRAD